MQNLSLPEIHESDLKAARDFLTSSREQNRPVEAARLLAGPRESVTAPGGIPRVRLRSRASKPA
jgi:hypothetical protein